MTDLEWLERQIDKTKRKQAAAESRGDVVAAYNLKDTLLRLNRIAYVMSTFEGRKWHEDYITGRAD